MGVDWWWSWLLGLWGATGFWLIGKKIWWAWWINVASQVVWFAYAVITEQYGFLVVTFIYAFTFTKSALAWTRDHFDEKSKA